jgi:hypothetical protein
MLFVSRWFICERPGSTEPMVGELMTLPVRVGVRATRCALTTTLTASARALTLAGGALQSLAGRSGAARPEPPASPRREPPRSTAPRRPPDPMADPAGVPVADPAGVPVADPAGVPVADPADVPVNEPKPQPSAEQPAPAHVSEEPELVAESADPGAEDGAGAAVTVDEPWEGYTRLTARDVADHLPSADPAELAAIQLYENSHKRRATVLTAVARELRTRA